MFANIQALQESKPGALQLTPGVRELVSAAVAQEAGMAVQIVHTE